ncbi:MAG: discoidin domain-containing protein [Bacteroidales bacterium]|nr:discoidin domain-containing protein [Bacteroidales bacterium]
MYGTVRNTGWGYSLWEFRIFGRPADGSDTQPPTAPSFVGTSPAQYACYLSWGASSDNVSVTQYEILLSGAHEDMVQGTNTSYTISNLNPDTQYTVGVRAYDAAGNISGTTETTFRTESTDPDGPVYGMGNIALGMPVTHSSVQVEGVNTGNNTTDGDYGSRWESQFTDNEWMYIDLGLEYYIDRVIIYWEAASGKHYEIQLSDDAQDWTTVAVFNEDRLAVEPRTDDLTFQTGSGRYIRMLGIERNTGWGWSIFEFEVHSLGSGPGDVPSVNPNPNPDPVPPATPSFSINSPANGAMITNTRGPTLSWQSSHGVDRYEVWVNITRTDYDWFKWGSLLDRFTKVGETTSTSYTLQQDLPDRWTYKWYIAAIDGSNTTYSQVGQFSIYIPQVEQVDDGINIINGSRDLNKDVSIRTYEDYRQPVEARVNDLMSQMTDMEKAYQMFYNAQAYPQSGWAFGPGTVDDMFNKQKASAGTRLGIPFVSAGDCIHGYGTSYPVQSALAATRNLEITRQCGDMHRREQVAVGFSGSLSPLAKVGTKVIYPHIQEGCGEDAEYAAAQVRAMVCSMQGGPELNPSSVMVTTKHWPGEGAGGEALIVYDGVTIVYHIKPWFANVDAGAGSVMPGYAGSSYLDPGGPGTGDSKPILDYLRDTVKFEGIVCTDWLPYSAWINSALAGPMLWVVQTLVLQDSQCRISLTR